MFPKTITLHLYIFRISNKKRMLSKSVPSSFHASTHIYSLFGNVRFNKMFGVCKVIGTRSKHFNSIIFWGFIGVMGVTVSITKLFFFWYRNFLFFFGVLFVIQYENYVYTTIRVSGYIICEPFFERDFGDFSLEPILQKHFQLCYYRMFMCCFRHFLYFFSFEGIKVVYCLFN